MPNILSVGRLVAAPALALVFVFFARPTADFIALFLFVVASATDWIDGYLARKWNQVSKFGIMIDPIADKAMVVIALALVIGLSGVNPLVVAPAAFILFREVFVSGLREFLGSDSSKLKVTKLAKWKTAAQMLAITFMFLSLGLEETHFWIYRSMDPADYDAALAVGSDDWNGVWRVVQAGWLSGIAGIALLWAAAVLTVITGWDYFRKAMPFLREE